MGNPFIRYDTSLSGVEALYSFLRVVLLFPLDSASNTCAICACIPFPGMSSVVSFFDREAFDVLR